MKRRLLGVLFLAIGLLTSYLSWNMSYAYNEDGRLASGVLYLTTGDYSSFRVNPPLVSMIGALPAVLGGGEAPGRTLLGTTGFRRHEYQAGRQFIANNANHRVFLFLGRLCCVAFVLLGMYEAFRFTKRIFNFKSGFIFLLLAGSCPYVLGLGALIVPDVASAFWGVAAVFSFWNWVSLPNYKRALCAGGILGIAELTKHTLLVLYPLFIALYLIDRFARRPTNASETIERVKTYRFNSQVVQLFFVLATSIFVVNIGYDFEGTFKQLRSYQFQSSLFTGMAFPSDIGMTGGNRFDGSGRAFETVLGYLPLPLPMNYIRGIDAQRYDFEKGAPSYLRGVWAERGWSYYYLYAWLVKIPLGVVCLFFLATFCATFLRGYTTSLRDELFVILPGITLLTFVSLQTGFSVHSRYALPALPFFFIWTSRLGRAFYLPKRGADSALEKSTRPQAARTVQVLTIVFATWSIASSFSAYPHSLSYFNELAAVVPTSSNESYDFRHSRIFKSLKSNIFSSGPLYGPLHLLDSNIDWGQDLYNLERWIKARKDIDFIKIAYWGSVSPTLSSLRAAPFDGSITPGWYAISVNNLYSQEKTYEAFLKFAPVETIGYSIYIYRLTQSDIDLFEEKLL